MKTESNAYEFDDLVDTTDMIVVHTALLRELHQAPALVEGAEGKQRMRVARHLFLVLALLHHHHEGEDRRLWPALAPRIPAAATHYLDDVIAQHDRIAVLVDRVERALTAWAEDAARTTGPALRNALADLHAGLAEHLHTEEEHLLPLAAVHLTSDEWHAVGAAAVSALPKHRLPLIFGLLTYDADPAAVRIMLAAIPVVPRIVLRATARTSYARYARRLYGRALFPGDQT
ncbi:hemerythrin domain-containing protein [Nocardia altamirensis]|uniref:hemerythrin domain-containing protein n=1 Tax=Nocardia altamirensis TaxID=472158 RepID=UPI0008403208|nr:hemerythrin domain-containing protein [Nocardia altamirensis]